ncbi:hypothetical protein QQF64_036057 [Cirrhinus molitorella]|uniref:Uncharacterized protein n=1 Tax=Cirrhinus molitorella TaxID=172907 RepID=A0ABR3NHI9_9TELE
MVPPIYLKLTNFIYLCTYLLLATISVAGFQVQKSDKVFYHLASQNETQDEIQEPIAVAALGRPLFLGMLYDCRKDSFIPGVTLWNKKSLSENLDIHQKYNTVLKFSSSDSLSSKFSLLGVSASLKASFLGGLVDVDGSAHYLHNTKSSNQQSRVTMYHSETTRFEELTMSQLGKFTYPKVFEQKTATHVVTAVLYGAQAFMVFDWKLSEDEDKQEIEGKLKVMVENIPKVSIKGDGSVNITDSEKNMAEKITCTFYGDVLLKQNPTTYLDALNLYKQLPSLLNNTQSQVPIKVWLHPLHQLDNRAAQMKREISTSLICKIEGITEVLGEAERTCNDLLQRSLVKYFSDIKERLHLFQESLSGYKAMLLDSVRRVLPAVREGNEEDTYLENILKIHNSSPFNAEMLNNWLDDAKAELQILNSNKKELQRIKIVDSINLNMALINPNIDTVVCLVFTSLKYEDSFLSTLKEISKFVKFEMLDKINSFSYVHSSRKWFKDHKVIKQMRENLSKFKSYSEAHKDEKRTQFCISAISNSSTAGSSIYLYENGDLTHTQLQPVPKPSPPIVINVLAQSVFLKMQTYLPNETVQCQYRVEYMKLKPSCEAEEQWLFIHTINEYFTLMELEPGNHYQIRYRIVCKVGVSEPSDTVSTSSFVQPDVVGGTGGDEFSFISSNHNNNIRKITITENSETKMTKIQVLFQDNQMIDVGLGNGQTVKEFQLEIKDKIVAATLWPNRQNTRFGGLEFVVEKMNGKRETLSIKCGELGKPVTVNVKSGICYGVKGRSGDEIDALGFYFI